MLALSPDYYPVLASDLAVERGRRKHLESKKRERGENIRSGEVGEGVKAREGANDKKYGRGVMDQRKRGEGGRSGTSSKTNWHRRKWDGGDVVVESQLDNIAVSLFTNRETAMLSTVYLFWPM